MARIAAHSPRIAALTGFGAALGLALPVAALSTGSVLTGSRLTGQQPDAGSTAQGQTQEPDALRPVVPPGADGGADPQAPYSLDGQRAPLPPFDAADYTARLVAADLEARETAFGELVERAVADGAARAWLEERSSGADELAWTARLALRELRQREQRGRQAPQPALDPWAGGFGFPPGADPFGHQQRMQGLLDALLGVGPEGLHAVPPVSGGVGPGQGSSESFSLQLGPDGVEVRVFKNVDGRQEERRYEAPDLPTLLRENPELESILGAPGGSGAFGATPTWPTLRSIPRGGVRSGVPVPQANDQGPRTDQLGVLVAPVAAGPAGEGGLLVHDTVPGSIAHVLGLARGDVLLAVNDVPLRQVEDLSRVLAERPEQGEIRARWRAPSGREVERVWRPSAPRRSA